MSISNLYFTESRQCHACFEKDGGQLDVVLHNVCKRFVIPPEMFDIITPCFECYELMIIDNNIVLIYFFQVQVQQHVFLLMTFGIAKAL